MSTLSPTNHREGYIPRGTTPTQLYSAQNINYSAVHPDTHEIMHPLGRMSAQVPGGMIITGMLLALYKYAYISISVSICIYIHV